MRGDLRQVKCGGESAGTAAKDEDIELLVHDWVSSNYSRMPRSVAGSWQGRNLDYISLDSHLTRAYNRPCWM
jgi:hypothetical protein